MHGGIYEAFLARKTGQFAVLRVSAGLCTPFWGVYAGSLQGFLPQNPRFLQYIFARKPRAETRKHPFLMTSAAHCTRASMCNKNHLDYFTKSTAHNHFFFWEGGSDVGKQVSPARQIALELHTAICSVPPCSVPPLHTHVACWQWLGAACASL